MNEEKSRRIEFLREIELIFDKYKLALGSSEGIDINDNNYLTARSHFQDLIDYELED